MTREEAINKIRQMRLPKETMEILEALAPELAESEDERIRRKMIEHFKAKTKETWCNMPVKDIVAYLEKQKEASKAIEAVERIDKYIDENLANAHDMKDSNPDKKYYRGWDDALGEMARILQDVYSDEKQKESLRDFIDDFPYSAEQKEQKPAEWSEEDEEILKLLILNIGRYMYFGGMSSERILSFLKSLRPRLSDEEIKKIRSEEYTKGFNDAAFGGKLEEWSEEDEKTFWGFTAYIPNEELERLGITRDDILKKLKSLRPQSKDEIYKEKNEAYKLGKHHLAIAFMNYLDENRPDGKMSLSNGECEDIDKAFEENDWAKIMRYIEKYHPSWKPSDKKYDGNMDKECIKLCYVLNSIPSIDTFESCCGHLKDRYSIWFYCNDVITISRLGRSVERNYSDGKWELVVDSTDTHPTGVFWLRSKVPFQSYDEMEESVNELCVDIQYWFNTKFDSYFNGDSCK